MTKSHSIRTDRLNMAYRRAGEGASRRLLFIHGNLSSSLFIAPLLPYLESDFDVVAPDLRCFGETDKLPVDATRGYRDFSDDLVAFVDALGWEDFDVCGWSMGGNVAMQLAMDIPERIGKLALLCPGSPYGFGGTFDEKGSAYTPVGLGSGAGTAHSGLLLAMRQGSRFILRDILTKFYFTPPFRMGRSRENELIDSISRIGLGEDMFPGNYTSCDVWPYVVAGDAGVLNAMAPPYADLSDFLELAGELPVLWMRGSADRIVSDESIMEYGYLGKLGLVPGWPGEDVYPPQPMISQLAHFFDEYESRGGTVVREVLEGGHLCALESPEEFNATLRAFLA